MRAKRTKPNVASTFIVRVSMFDVVLLLLLLSVAGATAAVRYVDPGSGSPAPPYTNWATAARVIQDAVDAALAGDEIVVSNGVYATGGRAVGTNLLVNRVAVDKPLSLRSVNGPQVTVIQGRQVPSTTNGYGANRCVYLTNGASLSGFTLMNGATLSGNYTGNYDKREVSGGGIWCESSNAMVTGCVLVNNSAGENGGGVLGGMLSNCTLTGNSTDYRGSGGGASDSILSNCTLRGNSAGYGGGAYGGTLYNCAISGNLARNYYSLWFSPGYGGGACASTLHNCTLSNNSATDHGGGAYSCTLYNTALTGNSAKADGGGACGGTLYNCTLTGNSAKADGGGACGGTLYNCIVYYNTAANGANCDSSSTLNYCCTTPLPPGDTGNIALDPQLASASHLSAGSPCREAGSATYAIGTDIDGEPWRSPPSIGCDEYRAGAATGSLSVAIVAGYTDVTVGFAVSLTALIEGRTTTSVWDFGDGIVASNRPYAAHAWANLADYAVVLRAYNESYPQGLSATVTVHVAEQRVHYVAAGNANPQPPYSSWVTAAANIQDAVDAANQPGALVLVTNGIYPGGLRVNKPLTLRSVNGPEFTLINGGRTNQCANLADGASLTGFTLTNGSCWSLGAGVRCASSNAFLTNCVIVGNSAPSGGGAYGGTLYNCTVNGNSAPGTRDYWGSFHPGCGGGACGSTLYECTLRGNSAGYGGGAYGGTLSNCTLSGNSATDGGGGADGSTLYNCKLTDNRVTGLVLAFSGSGGGADDCTLYDCTVTGNSAFSGGGAYRSTLYECTLTGNSATFGGGAYGGALYNCTLSGNGAWGYYSPFSGYSVGRGGGAFASTLHNCTLSNNSATDNGGGAYSCTLYNCTLVGNSVSQSGGGASQSTLFNCTAVDNVALGSSGGVEDSTLANCILAYNAAWVDANYTRNSTLNYCCTVPLPTNGVGNIWVPPQFVDYTGGNLRLQSNSPSINAGNNAYASGPTDLDGNPRIVSGTVDIGAYEFQAAGSVISYAWLQQYGLPTDGSADFADPDADGHNIWQEWQCLTDPTNALSALRLISASPTTTNVLVSWQSVAGVTYFLERSTNLSAWPPFLPLASGLEGQPGTTSYTDTNAAGLAPLFYRVGVNMR